MESRKMVLMTYLQGSNEDRVPHYGHGWGKKERVRYMKKVNRETYYHM